MTLGHLECANAASRFRRVLRAVICGGRFALRSFVRCKDQGGFRRQGSRERGQYEQAGAFLNLRVAGLDRNNGFGQWNRLDLSRFDLALGQIGRSGLDEKCDHRDNGNESRRRTQPTQPQSSRRHDLFPSIGVGVM